VRPQSSRRFRCDEQRDAQEDPDHAELSDADEHQGRDSHQDRHADEISGPLHLRGDQEPDQRARQREKAQRQQV
jgi:hypothetical protein